MTIREIEDASGLPRANVRYYESLGLIHPARAANGYRDYRQEDLDTLLKIKLLRQLDCSLEDIQALEKGTRSLDQVLSEVGDALEKKASETQHALELCRQLRADRPSWDNLQPERYLFWNPTISAELPPCGTRRIRWATAAPGGGILPGRWTMLSVSLCGSCFYLWCCGSIFYPRRSG